MTDEFKSYFTRFGHVVEHQIMQDHSTGRSRGFGFVTFDSEQTVEDILAQGKMHELGGKQVGHCLEFVVAATYVIIGHLRCAVMP